MGYKRHQFQAMQKWPRRVRHARVPLAVVCCVDCRSVLPSTHLFQRFGEQCRGCWSGDVCSAADSMAVAV